MLNGKLIGKHVGYRLVEECSELRPLGAELAGDSSPLSASGLGVILGERRSNKRGYHAAALPASVHERVAWNGHRSAAMWHRFSGVRQCTY